MITCFAGIPVALGLVGIPALGQDAAGKETVAPSELERFLVSIDPPTIEELIASTEVIPFDMASIEQIRVVLKAIAPESDGVLRARELEARIAEHRSLGEDAEAIVVAEELVALQTAQHGTEDWRSKDALVVLETAKTIQNLSDQARSSLAQADALVAQVPSLFGQAEYDRAIDAILASISIRREHLGGKAPEIGEGINDLAVVLHALGHYEQAETVFREALRLLCGSLGPKHPKVASSADNFGVMLFSAGRYEESEQFHRIGLGIRLHLLPADHPDTAFSLTNLGAVLAAKGEYDEAEELNRTAILIRRKIANGPSPDVASSLNLLGGIEMLRGKFDSAARAYQEATDYWISAFGAAHPQVAHGLGNLAVAEMARGDLVRAEVLARRAFEIRTESLGEDHPDRAESLLTVGSVLHMRGDLAGAESAYEDALAIWRQAVSPSNLYYQQALNRLAVLLGRTGRPEEAEPMLRESLRNYQETLGDDHPTLAQCMNHLAYVLSALGDDEQAETLSRRALEIHRKALGQENSETGGALYNLAQILLARGNVEEAEELLQQALSVFRRTLGEHNADTARALAELGGVRYQTGDFAGAEEYYQRALAVAENLRTYVARGEQERALFGRELAHDWLARRLTEILVRSGRSEEALDLGEIGRSRSLLDILARSDRDLAEMEGEEASALFSLLAEEVQANSAVLQTINSLSAAEARAEAGEGRRVLLNDLNARLHVARARLAEAEKRVIVTLNAYWPTTEPADSAEIRSALEPDELLLVYGWLDESVTLLVVPPRGKEGVQGHVLADGKDAVARLREVIRGENPINASELIPPAIMERVVPARRWIIVPDGPLDSIAFEALAGVSAESTGTPLLEHGPDIAYAHSGTVLLRLRGRGDKRVVSASSSSPTIVIVGDPSFEHREPEDPDSPESRDRVALLRSMEQVRAYGARMEGLPGTRAEAHRIADVVEESGGTVTVLLGEHATLNALEAHVAGKNLLHLATHGFPGTSDRPYDASLALARPVVLTEEDTGFLTLDRLMARWRGKLKGCELVVLSACDTQRGAASGDSVMALPWGFLYAGASSVIASLWRVDDTATALLMTRFYQGLLGNFDQERRAGDLTFPAHRSMPKSAALREAKSWLRGLTRTAAMQCCRDLGLEAPELTRGGPKPDAGEPLTRRDDFPYDDPKHWAAFVLLGDPD